MSCSGRSPADYDDDGDDYDNARTAPIPYPLASTPISAQVPSTKYTITGGAVDAGLRS